MSKYKCKCGGLILPDFDSFKIGDEVNFMIEKRKVIDGGMINVQQNARTGIISKIDGDDISVQSNKKTYELFRYGITPKDAPGPIEYFRLGKCRCELDQEQKPCAE
ncbi:hypothetical protein [Acinetobacter baumannii]|uniref:hypothetical protein n=1 Tax=Acinetobacter baumannii TaxID=470 RepID=UPI001901CF32|nr:hypothetical protein [Acinetobacter baumannii]EHZ6772505.1 hypothetical protein [Acinetobacter baumannii]EKU8078853.1 hypothetical protein [Acinetobacter baumannii]EKV1656347.1 hypothetical protein [Acinetobacter baumannii]EKV1845150.1 hypothetical protein [Acinetobacter baumannii]EKV1975291.1 hypothetical protein [Acinetobacter baumannii]